MTISAEITAIRNALAKANQVADGGFIDKTGYLDGLTEEQQASILFTKEHDEQFIAGAAAATGDLAIAAFEADPALERVEGKFHTIGRDYVTVRIDRMTESFNPRNREEKIVKYGKLSIDHHRAATNKNSGQLGHVQKELNTTAASRLAAEALAEA